MMNVAPKRANPPASKDLGTKSASMKAILTFNNCTEAMIFSLSISDY
jgi:hypothetical protein